jgi:single-strand DNA-binding protein
MNNCSIIGRLTKPVDLRYTPSGHAVGTFTIAVNRTFKNQNGEYEADFINCQVWKKQAENMENFTDKGSLVGITGRIQTRNFQNSEGKKVFITEVVAESVQFLEPKGQKQDKPKQSDPFGDAAPVDDSELPF